MKHYILLLPALLIAFSMSAKNEKKEIPINKIALLQSYMQRTEMASSLYPQEKVYLHFDNTSYYIGEHIWFKAYVTNATDNHLSELSRTLYVELVNKNGLVVERKVYPIVNGAANGDFLLKDTCEASYYEVRAYTRWIRNWDEACIFSRVFPVFNKSVSKGEWFLTMEQMEKVEPIDRRKGVDYENEVNFYFFPEGGNLVEGLSSQVAFKAVDENGTALNLKNIALYKKGSEEPLMSLQTTHNGMGLFVLQPEAKMKYELRAKMGKKMFSFPLPEALPAGYVLQVNNYAPKMLRVALTGKGIPVDTLGITLGIRGKVYASQLIYTNDTASTTLAFPKEQLPEGVAELTLFNYQGQILAERKVFIGKAESEQKDRLQMFFEEDSVHLLPCAFSEVLFKLTDANGKPLPNTNFSVSVRDAKTDIPTLVNESARINLLLSSDLKGCIEHPEYYFESADKTHQYALDLLMLTQGFRRYKWEELAQGTDYQPKFKAEKGIAIDGKAVHLMNKSKPYNNLIINYTLFADRRVSANDRAVEFDNMATDSTGEFCFVKNFFGSRRITLETRSEKGKKRETYLSMHRNFFPASRALKEWEISPLLKYRSFKEEEELDAKDFKDGKLLENVMVKSKRNRISRKIPHETLVIDVEKCMDEVRDQGEEVYTIYELLMRYDPLFSGDERGGRHNGKSLTIVIDDRGLKGIDTKKESFKEYCKYLENVHNWEDECFARPKSVGSLQLLEKDEPLGETSGLWGIKQIIIAEQPIGEAKKASAWNLPSNEFNSLKSTLCFINLFPNAVGRKEAYGQRKARIYGYNLVDRFYAPAYLTPSPEVYDGRRTLMWIPDVYTNADGIGQIDFYNSVTCRHIIIDAQAVSREGLIGGTYKIISGK